MFGWVKPGITATPLTGYRKRDISASAPGTIQNVFICPSPLLGGFSFGGGELPCIIFVDESGDLGWTFSAPYRQGGSSRHLTITAVCVPPTKSHLLKRVVRDLYDKFKWPTSHERKWVDMPASTRSAFAAAARKLADAHNDIHLHAIIVYKPNVEPHIQADPNKLYNYMIGLCLLGRMCTYDTVKLLPDKRAIKVESGRSLHDYLQIELWFTRNVRTIVTTIPTESHNSRGVQFADMLAGLVQSRFEDAAMPDFLAIAPRINLNRLFFP